MSKYRYLQQKISQWANSLRPGDAIPAKTNTLLITVRHELADTQMYPFHFYKSALQQRGIRFRELITQEYMASGATSMRGATRDIEFVFVQPPFPVDALLAEKLLNKIKSEFPQAKIIYMDWFAPADVRLGATVHPFLTRYVKKQLPRDILALEKPLNGDSNLADHYNKVRGATAEITQFTMPAGFSEKMVVGSNFSFSPRLIDYFLSKGDHLNAVRPITLHARLAVDGVDWYAFMRNQAQKAVHSLDMQNIVTGGRVKQWIFFSEMKKSKLCFSPFGYGEVCWRDYEAYATGSLLLKPSMDHLMVNPNSFQPNQTYVPLKWEFSDLAEKAEYYLNHEEDRLALCRNAFHFHRDYILSDKPLHDILALFDKLPHTAIA